MPPDGPAPFAIFGSGGFGREVAWLASSDPAARHRPLCFVDDRAKELGPLFDLPVLSFERFVEAHAGLPLVLAVAWPSTRRDIAGRLEATGQRTLRLVHDRVRLAPSVAVGTGSIICEGSLLTVDIALGRYVHVNLGCTVGHDVRIDDFVTLSPGVHVSGNVTIESGAFVGTGATIINGLPGAPLVIGADGVIGAGAVVTASTRPGKLYVGVPARPVESRDP